MPVNKQYCPDWTWWIQAGQRLKLGMDLRLVLQCRSKHRKKALSQGLGCVVACISEGKSVVESMQQSGMVLSSTHWSLLEVGEQTGSLGETMSQIGELMRDSASRRQELLGQLWYPGFVFLSGVIVMILILVWLVPQMRILGESMGLAGNLPWLTENIGFLYGAILLFAFALCGFLSIGLYLWSIAARRYLIFGTIRESLLRRIPVAGDIWRGLRESNTQQQLGCLLKGGITLPRSLEILSGLTSDYWESKQLLDFRNRLLMGSGIESALEQFAFFQSESVSLLLSGHQSGQMDEFLIRLSKDRERMVLWRLKQLIRLLEPLMLLVLSAAIGGLVMAYILPMVRMFEQVSL